MFPPTGRQSLIVLAAAASAANIAAADAWGFWDDDLAGEHVPRDDGQVGHANTRTHGAPFKQFVPADPPSASSSDGAAPPYMHDPKLSFPADGLLPLGRFGAKDPSTATATATAPVERRNQEDDDDQEDGGITINVCEDTFQLFGSSDAAQAFKSALDCSCEGDLTGSYAMTCVANNYCVTYDHGSACMDRTFTYYLETTRGKLPNSGYKRQTISTTYLSGDGPSSGELVTDLNPQCGLTLRNEHFFTSRESWLLCSHQELCPTLFLGLNYTQAQAEAFCPTTTLDGKQCATGPPIPCGPSAVDSNGDYSVDPALYVTTPDCSNVEPCAGSTCNPVESYEEGGNPIINNPVYPQCNADADSQAGSDSTDNPKRLDLYVEDFYRNFTSGRLSDAETCAFDCGAANGGSDDCILADRRLFVENHCNPRAKLIDDDGRGSSVFFTDGDKRCFRRYNDQECEDPNQFEFSKVDGSMYFGQVDGNCKANEELEQCDDRGKIWTILKGYCIASSKPEGPFTAPLVSQRVYASEESCEAHSYSSSGSGEQPPSNTVYLESLTADDPSLCQTQNYAKNNLDEPRSAGSIRRYCDADTGMVKTVLYTDDQCSVQDPDSMYGAAEVSIGKCDGPPHPELGVPEWARYSTPACEKKEEPMYHCKDLAAAGLGIKVSGYDNGGSPGSEETFSETSGDGGRNRWRVGAAIFVGMLSLAMSTVF